MITEVEAWTWMDAYGKAWMQQDPDRIVRLFTADAGYRERRFHPGLRGVEKIREYWQHIVHDLQVDVGFETVSLAVSADIAYVNWRSHFIWRPINGIMELDAMTRITFVDDSRDGVRLAREFEEWVDRREA